MTDASPSHLDLCSGLGGFAVAAQWAGFETVAFCEVDKRCRTFLEKTWGLPVYEDMRKLDGRELRGINLWTGGIPCQPASRAGKQRGAEDNRWLWPETIALFVWVPCADGKLRRAPNESFCLVNGLHRSVLAALGNSILPQAAYPILKAVKEVIWTS